MATQAVIRQRVYNYIYGAFPTEAPFVTRLTATYTDAEGVIDVLDGTQWEVNDVLENTATGELMKVVSISANILTVIHASQGTATAAAATNTDTLYKNPRFSQLVIDNAIVETMTQLEKWGIHIFGVGTLTRADPKIYYEVSDSDIVNAYGILRIYTVASSSEVQVLLPFRYIAETGTGPSQYSQGQGVHIGHFGDSADTDTLHYVYAKLINATTDLTARQEELVVVGATALIMGGTIVPATHDPGARSDRTVAPGQTSRDVRYFQGRFIAEARIEAAQLAVERQAQMWQSVHAARARRWKS